MNATMKAAIYENYGAPEVLQIKDIEKPAPKHHEVLIKIHATAANSGDCRLRKADPFAVRFFFGLFKPKHTVLGGVFSGEIESVGKDVTRFKPGDQVFGSTSMTFGAYAEYLCLPETGAIAEMPAGFGYAEAAVLPFGGATALQFLKKANIRPGQKVLVYGASGSVGASAVQIAKYFGAEVTAVCGPSNIGMVKSLGADHVFDYSQGDLSSLGRQFDVVYETVNKARVSSCSAVLKKGGILMLGAAMLAQMFQGSWASMTSGFKLIAGPVTPGPEEILFLQKMAAAGKLKPVVDKQFRLEQIAEAHRYVEQGHKKGNVVVVV